MQDINLNSKKKNPHHIQQNNPTPISLQQVTGTFNLITQATNEILGGNPKFQAEIQNLYTLFLTFPTTIKSLSFKPIKTSPTPQSPQFDNLYKEILSIKDTFTALSKMVKISPPKLKISDCQGFGKPRGFE